MNLEKIKQAAFEDEMQKIAVGPKMQMKGFKALFQRAGQELPTKVDYTGLEGLGHRDAFGAISKHQRGSSKYRLAAMQDLIKKNKPLSKEEFKKKLFSAVNESPNDSLFTPGTKHNEVERIGLRGRIEKKYGKNYGRKQY